MLQFSYAFMALNFLVAAPFFGGGNKKKESVEKADTIVSQVVEANSEFAFDLHRQLAKENKGKNLFFSPYSISNLFAMTWEGARENTADEMAKALKFSKLVNTGAKVFPGYRALNRRFNAPSKVYELQTLNALWGEQSFPVRKSYQGILSEQYGASWHSARFLRNSKGERQKINTWVASRTNNMIKDLIPLGSIDRQTRIVLVNATYFQAKWKKPFKVKDTEQANFTLTDGRQVKTSLMHKNKKRFRYVHLTKDEKVVSPKDELPKDGFQIIELPYLMKQGKYISKKKTLSLSMIIILPDKTDGLEELENIITAKKLEQWLELMGTRSVSLWLPKFKFETGYNLISSMNSLGMKEAFTPDANFSGICKIPANRTMPINFAVHRAIIQVDETGTVSVAASGGGFGGGGLDPPEFRADHPFLFLIRDEATGSILFLGRLMTP